MINEPAHITYIYDLFQLLMLDFVINTFIRDYGSLAIFEQFLGSEIYGKFSFSDHIDTTYYYKSFV